jgi:hypothetical protein
MRENQMNQREAACKLLNDLNDLELFCATHPWDEQTADAWMVNLRWLVGELAAFYPLVLRTEEHALPQAGATRYYRLEREVLASVGGDRRSLFDARDQFADWLVEEFDLDAREPGSVPAEGIAAPVANAEGICAGTEAAHAEVAAPAVLDPTNGNAVREDTGVSRDTTPTPGDAVAGRAEKPQPKPSIVLGALHDSPVVMGVPQEPLKEVHYEALLPLLRAFPNKLSLPELQKSKKGDDTRKYLKEIREINKYWAEAISMAKARGKGGYRIVAAPD